MIWTEPVDGSIQIMDEAPIGQRLDALHGALTLPPGYELVKVLARSATGAVVQARCAIGDVALRIRSGSLRGAEGAAGELVVLASIDHPGLARLVDHGRIDEHADYVARAWIEGEDLAHFAAHQPPTEHGRLTAARAAVRALPALDHLHRRGFLHADLKAENLIVTPDGATLITDFGLARRRDGTAAREIAGSLYALAPELLFGRELGTASDLFAFGVLLLRLFVTPRRGVAEFYARFPGEDFFSAADVRVEELPIEVRDVVAALLERDPRERPASAAATGRLLAGRLGLHWSATSELERIVWPARRGRTGWFDSILREMADRAAHSSTVERNTAALPEWWLVSPDEDDEALLEDFRLFAALRGAPTVRVSWPEGGLWSSADLDRFARDVAQRSAGAIVLGAAGADAWRRAAFDHLARALARCATDPDREPTQLIVAGHVGSTDLACAWIERDVPLISRAVLAHELAGEIEADDPVRFAGFVDLVHEAGRGSAKRLQRVLDRAASAGWLVTGDDLRRLRPGSLPTSLMEATTLPEHASVDALRLQAACVLFAEPVTLERAGAAAALTPERAAAAATGLLELHALVRDAAGRWRALSDGFDARLGRTEIAAIAARAATIVEAQGAAADRVLLLRLAASDFDLDARIADLARLAAALRAEGQSERALDVADQALRQLAERGIDPAPALVAEAALSWLALGLPARATATIEPLARDPRPQAHAQSLRVRAHVLRSAQDAGPALELLDAAVAIEPGLAGEAELARAQLAYDARREDELARIDRRAAAGEVLGMTPRLFANVRTLSALSLLRQGRVDEARSILVALLENRGRESDPLREAALRQNLGTLERRVGNLDLALEYLRESEASYERLGHLTGLAQARALLGGALRECARLVEAETVLNDALELRARSNDHGAASAVRGMLGLVRADRGHARAAIEDLSRVARELSAAGRSVDAALLTARADEVRARIAPVSTPGERLRRREAAPGLDADPRVLVARARAAALRGERDLARDLAVRARDLAHRLGQAAIEDEARLVHEELARPRGAPFHASDELRRSRTPAVDEDRRLLELLTGSVDAVPALELAERLEARGRDDRSARIYLAVAARAHTLEERRGMQARADACLARAAAGLSLDETVNLRQALCGLPDPSPADLVALALHDDETQEFEMDVLKLLEINRRLVDQQDLKRCLGAIVESALSVSGAERGFLVLEEKGALVFDTALDSRRGDIAVPDVEVSRSIVKQALDSGRVLRLSNAMEDPELGLAPSVSALDLRSIICTPFEIEPGLRGVIYVDDRVRAGAFDERAERLLQLLADQAALAIRQVRRLDEIRRLNEELRGQVVRKDTDLRAAHAVLREAHVVLPTGGLVGSSQAMRAVHKLVERAAQARLPVLVVGDSGTGKELVARALHALSPRARGPCIVENCASFPATLIEAELFGAKRGAFTGADADREGVFERADGGTLFLDEMGELPIELQAKLLRVIETGEVRRLGDTRLRKVDFRLVVATNRDLESEVRAGRFRADLYYRLNALIIALPSLAVRIDDIPELVDHFLRLESARGGRVRRISPTVLARLSRRAWPGNVRELQNEVARLCVMSEGDIEDPELVRDPANTPNSSASSAAPLFAPRTLLAIERDAIVQALQVAGGDKRKAADVLGISRAKIYQRLKEWRLDPSEDSAAAPDAT